MKINSKVPAEIIPVVFDFSEIIPAFDSVVEVGIAVIEGADADSPSMLIGSPTTNGATVVQLVRGGVADVKYRLYCLVAVGDEKYQIDGDMTVTVWHSK
ncbi:phage fiber-tail adaptor protein [Methylobacter marinus]|uniref:phage fiber-tail adaptor protein n=1 Tax=Methylobacter marinus TaxID=34058 RepID=UPI0003709F19|nr:hypothetical protein [Methylobacter marinus]